MYYLGSRYYDSVVKRFISSDDIGVILASPYGLIDKNLYSYCDNNPVMRVDHGGKSWDFVLDVVSIVLGACDLIEDPSWEKAGLLAVDVVLTVVPFIPSVSGARHLGKVDDVVDVASALNKVDNVSDSIKITQAIDFTDDAAQMVKSLDRSSGFTKSTASAGRKIHEGYRIGEGFDPLFKEYNKVKGIRPDYVDLNEKVIYELKPNNPQGIRSGIRQLNKYNIRLGGGFKLVLELY